MEPLSEYVASLLRREFSINGISVTLSLEGGCEQDCDDEIRFSFNNNEKSLVYLQVGFDYCLVNREIWNDDTFSGTRTDKSFMAREIYQTNGWASTIRKFVEIEMGRELPIKTVD